MTTPRHDTARNDTSVAVFAGRIATAIEKRPDLTFGQIIYEALQTTSHDMPIEVALNLRRMTDQQLIESIEDFVLKG